MQGISVRKLTFSAVLIGLGVLIPLVMPIKIVIGPATYTLGSHIPVFMAMFLGPGVAVAVACGTAFGFFLTFPPVVAMRALSHIGFAVLGAYWLQKRPQVLDKPASHFGFNLTLNLVHGFLEVCVVLLFFSTGNSSATYIWTMIGLLGFGGCLHGMLDYSLAYLILRRLPGKMFKPLLSQSR